MNIQMFKDLTALIIMVNIKEILSPICIVPF